MLFNSLGRNVPSASCRVFSEKPREFYKIDKLDVDYSAQHEAAKNHGLVANDLVAGDIAGGLNEIESQIRGDDDYKNLFAGTAIPFCLSKTNEGDDIGACLEDKWLPMLKDAYEKEVPGAYFKATLQGNTELKSSVTLADGTRYDKFLEKSENATLLGYYFPTAFQEFDIASQRKRIAELPAIGNLNMCLSGPFEMIYSLISYPQLLFSKDNYCPILCMSALEHNDPRMVLMLKSYGPHLEFWLMSQMLSPTKTQVSEQWAGGLTVYKTI